MCIFSLVRLGHCFPSLRVQAFIHVGLKLVIKRDLINIYLKYFYKKVTQLFTFGENLGKLRGLAWIYLKLKHAL